MCGCVVVCVLVYSVSVCVVVCVVCVLVYSVSVCVVVYAVCVCVHVQLQLMQATNSGPGDKAIRTVL